MKVTLDQQNDSRKTLTKAVINVAEILGVSEEEFLKILKLKKSSIVS